MSTEKKSFIAYYNWGNTFNKLPDEDAGKLVKHMFSYARGENPVAESVLIDAVFENIKDAIDRNNETYEAYLDKQKKNGSKGGRPKKE